MNAYYRIVFITNFMLKSICFEIKAYQKCYKVNILTIEFFY